MQLNFTLEGVIGQEGSLKFVFNDGTDLDLRRASCMISYSSIKENDSHDIIAHEVYYHTEPYQEGTGILDGVPEKRDLVVDELSRRHDTAIGPAWHLNNGRKIIAFLGDSTTFDTTATYKEFFSGKIVEPEGHMLLHVSK